MSVLVVTGSARAASCTRRLGEAVASAVDGGVPAPRLLDLPTFSEDLEGAVPAEV